MFDSSINAINNSLKNQAFVAQNIANLNTKGYSKMSFENQNTSSTQFTQNVSNDVDLSKQLVNSNLNLIDLAANVKVLKSQNKMFGYLLDITI